MDFLPGFAQGITRVLISYPFDYIKLHLQTNKYNSINNFFKNNNIKSLYRGIQVPLLIIPIERAIQFKIYENLNNYNISPFISGPICSIFNLTLSLPSSYINNNYILNKKEKSSLKLLKKTLKKPNNLYNGIKPEILRSIIGTSLYFSTYGFLRNNYGDSFFQTIINSSITSYIVWTIVYPLDTLKVEQQTNNKKINNIIKYRISKYGFSNLWKGIIPIYIRTMPSSICGMLVYEYIKKNI